MLIGISPRTLRLLHRSQLPILNDVSPTMLAFSIHLVQLKLPTGADTEFAAHIRRALFAISKIDEKRAVPPLP